MMKIKDVEIEKGLYEVTIEKTNMVFDAWNDDYVIQNESDVEYVFVNNYKSFEGWLENKYAESDTCRIRYRKVSEHVTVLN